MTNNHPIGLFDSGIGGTSIWKEVIELLPYESTIFLADSKNAPYGEKSQQAIIDLSVKNTEYLIGRNCKIIVVACNTATTNAIEYLRKNYHIPFIGIEPAIKPAALKTRSKSVGVLATKGTLTSSLFSKTASLYTENIQVMEQVGIGLVDLMETGKLYSLEMTTLLNKYMRPMLQANIDYLVLGCTHYPYLIPQLKEILPETVTIIDSGEAVARQTKNILEQNQLLHIPGHTNTVTHELYSNLNAELLKEFVPTPLQHRVKLLDF